MHPKFPKNQYGQALLQVRFSFELTDQNTRTRDDCTCTIASFFTMTWPLVLPIPWLLILDGRTLLPVGDPVLIGQEIIDYDGSRSTCLHSQIITRIFWYWFYKKYQCCHDGVSETSSFRTIIFPIFRMLGVELRRRILTRIPLSFKGILMHLIKDKLLLLMP